MAARYAVLLAAASDQLCCYIMCQHKNSVELRRGQIKAVVLGCQPVRKCPTLANMTAAAMMTAEADNSTRQHSTSTARSDVQLFTGFTFFFQQTFLGCLAAISADSSCYLPQRCARMGRYCISGDTKNCALSSTDTRNASTRLYRHIVRA